MSKMIQAFVNGVLMLMFTWVIIAFITATPQPIEWSDTLRAIGSIPSILIFTATLYFKTVAEND